VWGGVGGPRCFLLSEPSDVVVCAIPGIAGQRPPVHASGIPATNHARGPRGQRALIRPVPWGSGARRSSRYRCAVFGPRRVERNGEDQVTARPLLGREVAEIVDRRSQGPIGRRHRRISWPEKDGAASSPGRGNEESPCGPRAAALDREVPRAAQAFPVRLRT